MTWKDPEAFFLLLFTPVCLDLVRRLRWRSSSALRHATPLPSSQLAAVARLSPRGRFGSIALSIAVNLVYLLLVIALARPQSGSLKRDIEADARDIFFALDISASMQALDFFVDGDRVDRLQALKQIMNRFIERRQGDRLGLVIFGDRVFTQCPLTLDTAVVRDLVNALQVGMAGQGTAIGDGLGIALKRFEGIPGNSRAIVLVTDGKNNSGTLQPRDAAQIARQMNVKVYVVGIGGPEPAPFPTKNVFGLTVLTPVPMEYDEATLAEIAAITGGVYFNAKDTEGLEKIYDEIDSLERRSDHGLEYIDQEERYEPFLLGAVFVLLIAELFQATWLLRFP